MQPGDRLVLHIEKAVAGGRMLARHEGAILLVSGTIPGETVEAEIEKVQRGTMWAIARRVVEASPDRVPVEGDWLCGGSVYAHVRYERQLDLKRGILRDAFARVGRLTLSTDIPVVPSPVDGYRMRARVHWRDGRLGYFREGTHEVCDPASTRQLLPETVEALNELARNLSQRPQPSGIDIEISENRPATERVCHFGLPVDADPSQLASLRVNSFSGASCGLLHQSRSLTVWGSPIVTDTFEIVARDGRAEACRVRLSHHARAFFQANRYLLPDLVSHVVGAVPGGNTVDLYAGVGLFSVALAACGRGNVTAIEGDRVSAEDLKRNAAPFRDTLIARHQPVETFLSGRIPQHLETVIVDPPRTGMTRDALSGAIGLRPARVVYVSCDVATLARDARRLTDAGYGIRAVRAFDLFPNTAHVETVAVFDRE